MNKATEAFDQGKLVAMPTETVYGLAAPIDRPELLKKIFTLKERPFFDPLIVHVKDADQAKTLVNNWPELASRLVKAFWPGPLTLVFEKNPKVISDMITSGLTTVAIRCPKHELALNLITDLGVPVAAPSANKFGKTSPTTIDHVKSEFSEKDVYFLDGGSCEVGIESTILSIESNKVTVLRRGLISEDDIKPYLKSGEVIEYHNSHEVIAPGQVKHHYMPKIPLLFFRVKPTSELIKLEAQKLSLMPASTGKKIDLSNDAKIAARTLYSSMRDLSETGSDFLYCYIPKEKDKDPNWLGIIDRLQKASKIEVTEPAQS